MTEGTPKLNKAIAAAQLEMSNPKFDAQNPHFKSKFASLKAVREAVIPVFNKHGVAVIQELLTIDGDAAVTTHLQHESGEEKSYGPFAVPRTKNDAQGIASASTYARRYTLQSVAGVVGEEDDDGNAASAPKRKKMPEKQARELATMLDEADPETGDGVDAFGEAWRELNQDDQLGFAPWIGTFYPGQVSKTKAKMHEVMAAYRQRLNGDSE